MLACVGVALVLVGPLRLSRDGAGQYLGLFDAGAEFNFDVDYTSEGLGQSDWIGIGIGVVPEPSTGAVLLPGLLALAWSGASGPFLGLFALGLLTDALDGALARRLGQESEFGARLDQWGDFALWACLPLAAWWLWPEIVRREAPYVLLALVCMLVLVALLFDERDSEQTEQVLKASGEILDECLACGGSVTGEHGIGVEKIGFMSKMFTEEDLSAMANLRRAFNPQNNLSPDKMLPTAGACGLEQKHPGRRAAL